ncbi:HAD family hydrolase [Halobacteriales archaeon QH_7_66_36]|nr:MAG: HAD family hydrolase [Halobacteriales archaeon QH_7_66_36]
MSRYAATVFDLDNTLCSHDQDVEAAFHAAFRDVGHDPISEPRAFWGTMEPITAYDSETAQLADAMGRLAAERGRGLDAEAWAEAFVARLDWTDVSLLPGAEAALSVARANGPVGLLTNGPESRQSTKLAALGLGNAFDAVVYAGDMRRRKPHPDPFERTVADLEIAADETLYVGDSLEHDVAGARGAGLPVAWITDDASPGDHAPDHTLRTVGELSSVLRG